MSVFNTANKDTKQSTMFLDESVGIARYDEVKYSQFDTLTEQQLGFFWRPQEIDLSKDIKDFRDLTDHEKHIFTANLKRQILLDSVQGRAPALAFLPIVSLPELETWIVTWTFSETIHSKSYTHIIRNIYSDPAKVFDEIMDIKEIVDCAGDISKYYDDLIECNLSKDYASLPNVASSSIYTKQEQNYRHKKAIWLALQAVNALEGVRFYASFACSWAFAEMKKMEGNAKIIKLICRDENLHLGSTQYMLKMLPKDDAVFAKIAEETKQQSTQMFVDVVNQEKAWADYLFKDGSMIGLNAVILKQYVEWIANKRMRAIGLESPYDVGTNPLPWTQRWIAGAEVQVAPQEAELSSYITGAADMTLEGNAFSDFEL